MSRAEFQYRLTSLQDMLKRFAYSLTNDWDDANDLLQDTMLKALNYQCKYRDENNFKAWVYTIMRNIFINDYRRKKRIGMVMESQSTAHNRVSDYHYSSNPHSALIYKQLSNAVNSLKDEYRLPLTMHQEGYKYQEIAEKMAIPMGTVKSRIFLAKDKLSKILNQ